MSPVRIAAPRRNARAVGWVVMLAAMLVMGGFRLADIDVPAGTLLREHPALWVGGLIAAYAGMFVARPWKRG